MAVVERQMELLAGPADARRPAERLTVSEVADRGVVLPAEDHPEAGPFRTDRVPYLRGMQDCVADRVVEDVTVCAAIQVGKGLGARVIAAGRSHFVIGTRHSTRTITL